MICVIENGEKWALVGLGLTRNTVLITHLHLVPLLRISGAISLLSLYVSMA
jgi:hypothetical protein